jgi:hypothetical protein
VPGSKQQRVALVNVAFNLAVHFSQSTKRGAVEAAAALTSSGAITACNELLRVVLTSETESVDVVLRALQAVGAICATFVALGGNLSSQFKTGMLAAVAVAAGNWAAGSEPVKACSAEVALMLKE